MTKKEIREAKQMALRCADSCLGILFPMTQMILLETAQDADGHFSYVMFRNSRTDREYQAYEDLDDCGGTRSFKEYEHYEPYK